MAKKKVKPFKGYDFCELGLRWGLFTKKEIDSFDITDKKVIKVMRKFLTQNLNIETVDGVTGLCLDKKLKEDCLEFLDAISKEENGYRTPLWEALIVVSDDDDHAFVCAFCALLPMMWT